MPCLLLNEGHLYRVTYGERKPTQVYIARRRLSGGQDNLDWMTIIIVKNGTQAFVTLFKGAQAAFKSVAIQRSLKTQGQGNTVGGTSRVQLIKEPEPLLRKRKWKLLRPCNRFQWEHMIALLAEQSLFYLHCQFSHGRSFEESA